MRHPLPIQFSDAANFVVLAGCSTAVTEKITNMLVGRVHCHLMVFKEHSDITNLPGYSSRQTQITPENSSTSSHLIVVEEGHQIAKIIATNLCVATGSQLVTIAHVDRKQFKWVVDRWRTWSVASGLEMYSAKDELFEFINSQLIGLPISDADSITFLTFGVPYGVLNLKVPVSHHFVFPLLGVSVVNGIIKSQETHLRCPLAVLIDPQKTEHSECASVANSFGSKGYLIRQAIGDQATVQNARYLTEAMPSDILFFSTHCGEVRGDLVTDTIIDQSGIEHTLIYERVISFAPSPATDLFEVLDFKRFVSLNGILWTDDEGKKTIRAGEILELFTEFWRDTKLGPSVNRKVHVTRTNNVQFSDCLQMNDGVYKPMPQLVGGWMHPIIMNNACSSCRELASWFMCKGTSNYLGTTRDTPDSMSAAVATTFADLCARGAYVGKALFEAQKAFAEDLGYSPYLLYGNLFNNLPPPQSFDVLALVESQIGQMINGQIENPGQAKHHRDHMESIRAFLGRELEGLRVWKSRKP